MTHTTLICSMIGPVCSGASPMSTEQFESSLLVTMAVPSNSYAAPWNSSCWLPAIAIPTSEQSNPQHTDPARTSGSMSTLTSKKR